VRITVSSDNGEVPHAEEEQVWVCKSLKPTSKQLQSMCLKPGPNKITFSVESELRGLQTVSTTLYLWESNCKIVISDIDGTITRSDVFGQIMPMLGRDWSQAGVARLYSNIQRNGYNILYLTSRAIGQASVTKNYIESLQQEDVMLPKGPVFMSPDRLLQAFSREVIRRKPHEFKIACLKDINSCFPDHYNPFYAGFGNRESDVISYLAVNVNPCKVFIINHHGEIRTNNHTYNKTYTKLNDLVHAMFPPTVHDKDGDEHFNEWNYWRVALPPLEVE